MQKWLNRSICRLACIDSGGPRKRKFNRVRQEAPMCLHRRAHWRHLANTTEPYVCGGDAALCHSTLTTCHHYYLRRGGYFLVVVCLSVCLSICLLAALRKNFQKDLNEIFNEDWQWANEQMIKCWWRSGSQGYRDCFPDSSLSGDTKMVSTDCAARRCSARHALASL